MKTEDLTGRRYGKLTVIGFDHSEEGKRCWLCRCDCGNTRVVQTSVLNRGFVTSCGCANKTNKIDLTGQRFGRLVVLCQVPTEKGEVLKWECVCDCGKTVVVKGASLRYGLTQSCGCLRAENEAPKEDAYHRQRLYGVWAGMMQRCFYKNHASYSRYGGRGITVCEEWKDYANFRKWAYANGYDENHGVKECTLDRIDNDGNYCPENCRWVDRKTQNTNRSVNHIIEYQGKTLTVSEVAELVGVKPHTLLKRLKSGKTVDEATIKGWFIARNYKPVRCQETGEVFESVESAAAHIGVSPSAISRALSKRAASGGFHWSYFNGNV